jgi:hypothetical protein
MEMEKTKGDHWRWDLPRIPWFALPPNAIPKATFWLNKDYVAQELRVGLQSLLEDKELLSNLKKLNVSRSLVVYALLHSLSGHYESVKGKPGNSIFELARLRDRNFHNQKWRRKLQRDLRILESVVGDLRAFEMEQRASTDYTEITLSTGAYLPPYGRVINVLHSISRKDLEAIHSDLEKPVRSRKMKRERDWGIDYVIDSLFSLFWKARSAKPAARLISQILLNFDIDMDRPNVARSIKRASSSGIKTLINR